MKYFVIKTLIRHDEKEFNLVGLWEDSDGLTEEEIAHKHLMHLYDDFYDTDGRWYSYESGSIMARAESIAEIDFETYKTIEKYL